MLQTAVIFILRTAVSVHVRTSEPCSPTQTSPAVLVSSLVINYLKSVYAAVLWTSQSKDICPLPRMKSRTHKSLHASHTKTR